MGALAVDLEVEDALSAELGVGVGAGAGEEAFFIAVVISLVAEDDGGNVTVVGNGDAQTRKGVGVGAVHGGDLLAVDHGRGIIDGRYVCDHIARSAGGGFSDGVPIDGAALNVILGCDGKRQNELIILGKVREAVVDGLCGGPVLPGSAVHVIVRAIARAELRVDLRGAVLRDGQAALAVVSDRGVLNGADDGSRAYGVALRHIIIVLDEGVSGNRDLVAARKLGVEVVAVSD